MPSYATSVLTGPFDWYRSSAGTYSHSLNSAFPPSSTTAYTLPACVAAIAEYRATPLNALSEFPASILFHFAALFLFVMIDTPPDSLSGIVYSTCIPLMDASVSL